MQIAKRIERNLIGRDVEQVAQSGAVTTQEISCVEGGLGGSIGPAMISGGVGIGEHECTPDIQPVACATRFSLVSDRRMSGACGGLPVAGGVAGAVLSLIVVFSWLGARAL